MTEYLDIPKNKTLAELGLDAFGQSPLVFTDSEENKKALSATSASVPSNFIMDGDMISDLTIRGTFYVNDGTNDRILIGYASGLF
jgi:hypothetical protein